RMPRPGSKRQRGIGPSNGTAIAKTRPMLLAICRRNATCAALLTISFVSRLRFAVGDAGGNSLVDVCGDRVLVSLAVQDHPVSRVRLAVVAVSDSGLQGEIALV